MIYKTIIGLVATALLVSTSLAAAATPADPAANANMPSALAPGKAAGVQKAQNFDGTDIVYGVGAAAILVGGALLVFGHNGHGSGVTTTTTTTGGAR